MGTHLVHKTSDFANRPQPLAWRKAGMLIVQLI